MTPTQLFASNDLLVALDLVGVVVMGITGGALARRLNFDAVGFGVVGIVSGLGGGLLRDLILARGVPAAFAGSTYLLCALAGAAFSYVFSTETRWWRRSMTVLDCLALGLWAAAGTAKSLGYGMELLPAILLGVTSAVGGGAIRDVVVGRIPAIFGGNPLYATSALLTAVTTWGIIALGLPPAAIIGPVLLGAGLAIIAAWRQWGLPVHRDWQVTMSASQMKALVRRVRRSERARIAHETGMIPVITPEMLRDDYAADALGDDDTADDYILADDGSGSGIFAPGMGDDTVDPGASASSSEKPPRDPEGLDED